MPTLYEERASVWAQMDELVKAGAETWDADSTTKYDNLETEYRSLTEKIEKVERHARLGAPAGPPVAVVTPDEKDESETRAAEYASAFDRYVRFGEHRMSAEERSILHESESRTMSTTTDSEGGYLVPDQVRATIIEALKTFGGARRLATVITTENGQKINIPTNDDTGNVGEIIAENAQVTDQDIAFGVASLDAFIYSSKMVKAPVSLLEDSAVDLSSFIDRKLGERIGRLQSTHFLYGTGTGQPQGLVVGRDTSLDLNLTATITSDNLVDLTRKVDPAYRPGAAFLMNDTTTGTIRKLKGTTYDVPIWQPSLQLGDPDRILGYPVEIDNGLPNDAFAAGGQDDVPVLFGNFREAYIVRDVKGIAYLRLAELYARFRQVAFIAFIRTDGRVVNNKAYAAIERTA